jgi:hypothetical protein
MLEIEVSRIFKGGNLPLRPFRALLVCRSRGCVSQSKEAIDDRYTTSEVKMSGTKW